MNETILLWNAVLMKCIINRHVAEKRQTINANNGITSGTNAFRPSFCATKNEKKQRYLILKWIDGLQRRMAWHANSKRIIMNIPNISHSSSTWWTVVERWQIKLHFPILHSSYVQQCTPFIKYVCLHTISKCNRIHIK